MAALTLAAGFMVAPAAHASDGTYAALGDSYAVAVGSNTYDTPATDCRRGPTSYPRLWAAQHPSYTFVEAACSGATTADVINTQIPQIPSNATLVTVQVGGNDVGFVDVLENCILTISDSDCLSGVAQSEAAAQNVLPAALAQTYAAIRAQAPNARVIVVGYPRLYTIGGDCGILGLSDTERTALNGAADVLAGVTATAAANAGFTFLDARPVFDPHSICSGNGEWLNSLDWSKIDESYHPTATGYADGYLPALDALTG
ncbi:SGNH/GDSL hydrolase family protein [Streptomyces sp. SL13]|uniref:SGNH/GDSL hydrolase family protein n=1 Tax=Streptantibioticus silvisoli TaxID=2705255 RepID=A0AA90K9G0_9ACTN|nr:SGNH/GDSL hydrolase family protein [Streptantibioticus silvisoli]MDI5964640.1 SGNH/GDSL hydrolase family protein [Streptantibioticus silvisoli]MDI5970857.1 SGNH/GDSL hydrolase family protein [Streptantibioticus silvisoli]